MNKTLVLWGIVILTALPPNNVSSNAIKDVKREIEIPLDKHIISIKQEEIIHELSSTINRKDLYGIEQEAINEFGNDFFNYDTKIKLMSHMEENFNELKYQSIYVDPNNLLTISNLNENDFNLLLFNTPMENKGYIFELIEKELGVNGLFILSLAQQESGLGNSNMARQKNNLTGYAAYDHNTGAAVTFNSFEDCIYATAKGIKENYLLKAGEYHHGTSIFDINIKYCSQIDWSIKIIDIMFSEAKQIENNI